MVAQPQSDGSKLTGFETGIHRVMLEPKADTAGCSLEIVGTRFLLKSQNPDGGWGFQPVLSSATEPTAWAIMGLEAFIGRAECRQACEKGMAWLEDCQLKDGSWPAHLGQREGCWVTSVACLALASKLDEGIAKRAEVLSKGLRWLLNDWPGEGNLWWRLLRMLEGSNLGRPRGWSWTPGTSGWIEPTAQALLAVQAAPPELYPRGTKKRIQMAQAMLLNQALASGGWNSGSSESYGYAGRQQPGPTSWALMALRSQEQGQEIAAGLEWLQQIHTSLNGFFSFSLACLCLNFWEVPYDISRLQNTFFTRISPGAVMEMGWTLLAISPPEESPLGRWRGLKS